MSASVGSECVAKPLNKPTRTIGGKCGETTSAEQKRYPDSSGYSKSNPFVRGTLRSAEKSKWLHELFDKKYGAGRFECVPVPDMLPTGVSGIVHLASIVTFSTKVEEVVPPTVKGTIEVLKSAVKEPEASTCLLAQPGKVIVVTEDTWNESAIAEAHNNDPSPNPWVVYAASKTEAEKPSHFQVSTVVPNVKFGQIFQPGDKELSTAGWVVKLSRGAKSVLQYAPQWFVNVADTARLHVAGLIDPSCNGKRIFAFAAPYTWNEVLAILRKQNPGREFMEDAPDQGRDLSQIPNHFAEALLKKHYQKGFTGLEETVRENSRGLF
ncbi:aldehyde reductase II [Mycena polygramma]|nr:aldehyde reductase II [Mycena polygramma]